MVKPASDLAVLTRRWFEEVWNNGNTALIDEMLDPNAVAHGLGDAGADLRGAAIFRPFYDKFRAAFPDLKIQVHDVLVDGEQTAARFTFTATHTGQFQGFAPSRRRVRASAIAISRWKNGRIIEAWNEFDAAGLMAQIASPPANAVR
jgi:steroid delta-isomerase-like uncharacterized protein